MTDAVISTTTDAFAMRPANADVQGYGAASGWCGIRWPFPSSLLWRPIPRPAP